jgi:hypothetical protein
MLSKYIQMKGYSYEDFVSYNLLDEYDSVYKFTPVKILNETKF